MPAARGEARGQQLKHGPASALGGSDDTMAKSQAVGDQIMPALARVRSILDDLVAQLQETATEIERTATRHAQRGDIDAARIERRSATVLERRLESLDAAFQALDNAAFAALDLEAHTTCTLLEAARAAERRP
jgi:hypothetical protein